MTGAMRSPAVEPIDCKHKRANHQHGTPEAYILDKCRCTPCRESNVAREAQRRRLIAYGRYDTGRVDAAETRAHLHALAKHGMGIKRVAELAGVSNATLGKVLYGDPSRNMPPRARVSRHVHDAVLAVRPSLETLAGGALTGSTGTRRRIQALVWMGYSISYQAERIGVYPSSLHKSMHKTTVAAATAKAISRLYVEIENRPRIGHDQRTRISITRSKSMARRNGWLPPAAWEEDLMDDPRHRGYPQTAVA